MEVDGTRQRGARHTMSDVLNRPSDTDRYTTESSPEPRLGLGSVTDKISGRRVAGLVIALVVGWWLFVADTAANNDLVEGLDILLTGFARLPSLLLDLEAYQSWWEWMSTAEGWSAIFERVVEHVQLVAMSMSIAIVISVVLGVVVHRVHALRGTIIGFASLMLTIPSLALFAIFISIPAIGVGDRGPIIALVMYSILPIVRNTVTGLEDVDHAVIESAKGMGLNKTQRLLQVELPLAWPIILTGIRVATLLNIGIAAIAPLVGGTGLGRYIGDGLQRFPDVTSVERMWTGVVFTIVLALIADLFFSLVRRFTTSKGIRS
jgi:osmoprotectant transport system permease protein